MTLNRANKRLRVLLLSEDPVEIHLLRTLLRALPEPRPEIVSSDPASDPIPAIARDCDHCIVDLDYAGLSLDLIMQRLRRIAPDLHIHGILNSANRDGDRLAMVRAMRTGMSSVLALEELSLTTLTELLCGESPAQTLVAAPEMNRLAPAPRSPTHPEPDTATNSTSTLQRGSWCIRLAEQRASFDADTMLALGYSPGAVADGIGDWKALIHPEDVDRLVQELQHVLDNSAPPFAVRYRLCARDGSSITVVSDDISLQLGSTGEPQSISGQFYREMPGSTSSDTEDSVKVLRAETRASSEPRIAEPELILDQCDTAMSVYRRDGSGAFRIAWCNPAAAALERRDAADLLGANAREAIPAFNGFEIEEALGRVLDTGIAESHEVMSIARSDQPHWRRIRLSRLSDAAVLTEAEDISEQVNARVARRVQDELAQYVVRSLPLTALLADEQGRIVQCISATSDVLGADSATLENSTLTQLFGSVTGAECLQQITRTLNTGRICSAVHCVGTEGNRRWLECVSAVLRGRPGMPQRVVLTLQDISQRIKESDELNSTREQLRTALQQIPLALYLKDIEGRYQIVNPAFEALFGIEQSMLIGKTDFEVFPDELATEMHEEDLKLVESGKSSTALRIVGQGAQRDTHYCFQFPWRNASDTILGSGAIWLAPADIPGLAVSGGRASNNISNEHPHGLAGIPAAAASIIGRVEDVLTESGDYSGVLQQLEQLVATTMQAQALIHQVAGQTGGGAAHPLIALTPLAQEITEIERILLPADARMENQFPSSLPNAQCDPVVFNQILLRAIRHARRTLGPQGTLTIMLRHSASGKRACVSCREGFEGDYVELVVEDSDSHLSGQDIARLTAIPADLPLESAAINDLAEIHKLTHAQGGHLQIQQTVPAGTSLHVFFRAGESGKSNESDSQANSTVARFPRLRSWHQKDN